MEPIIRVRGLSFAFGEKKALDDLDLEVYPGDFAALLGRNGAGKSVLLSCLAGLLRPDKGEILIDGQDISRLSRRSIARALACAPQFPHWPPAMTVEEFAMLGRFPWLDWTGAYGYADREIASRVLGELKLESFRGREAATLSGGERQSLSLAQALIQLWEAPRGILLLDEPTASMDWSRALATMEYLSGKKNLTVLMVAHDANLAALFANRLIGLKNGRAIFNGPAPDAFTAANLGAIYDLDFGLFAHPDAGRPQAYPRLRAGVPRR